jgi:hypothetical protein
MAWVTPITWTVGQTVTASQLNVNIRDNMNETSVAKTTTAGSYTVGTAANAIAERTIGHAFDSSSDTTSSTTFTDLSGGASPSVPVTTGAKAIVFLTASMQNNTVNALCAMGTDVSGATTVAPSSFAAVRGTSATANANITASAAYLVLLTPGLNTFTAKYLVSAGTGSWGSRRILIQSF